ncbi:hypothetical protein EVAR_91261_1 [Eumeta japonica]|uniref:Uncharacterized protein n=1 Tax=Eumeta variegata TaxID=151549 RepID=A0A4C1T7X8_EUMVA|nr:hypothetical protein EVAR_91261_1 [Eumeta japonica]
MSEYGIDIALIQETFLKPNRPRACAIAGYIQLRTDRTYARKVTFIRSPAGIVKMGPPDGGRPIPTIKITDWKKVSTAFEKSTPPLNSIPDDIRTTEQIDHAIGALTSHVRTVVKRCEREVPASSDRRSFRLTFLN